MARQIIGTVARTIARARLLSGVMHSLGVPSIPYIQHSEQCLRSFVGYVKQARSLDPDVPWELCVDVAVQQLVLCAHDMFHGEDVMAPLMQGAMETARTIKNTVYMAEKLEATLQ